MSAKTSIEWTDASWNPVTGCTRVSAGCQNCWAERMAARMSKPGMWGHGFAEMTSAGPRWTGRVEVQPERLDIPLRWRRPRRIFLSSFDLFHGDVPFEAITAIYGVMAASMQHTFQVLTKRPQRRKEWAAWLAERDGLGPYIRTHARDLSGLFDKVVRTTTTPYGQVVRSVKDPWCQVFNAAACIGRGPLGNVWEGVSVEDQKTADERIPLLLETPAAVRFVSYEPALGPVDFENNGWLGCFHAGYEGRDHEADHSECYPTLDWVIVGGESGPHARPFNVEWARSVIRQCKEAGTAAFVKQLGARPFVPRGNVDFGLRLKNRKGGDWSEWPEDLRVREFPVVRQ